MIHSAPKAVRDILGADYSRCDSPSLRLEKFVRVPGKGRNEQEKKYEARIKKEEVQAVIDRVNALAGAETFATAIPLLPQDAKEIKASLGGRLIVDPSGSLIEHAGMKIHPHFGMPYIPGSSVKGVARHAAWCDWRDANEADKPMIANHIADVFGYPTNEKDLDEVLAKAETPVKAGNVAFFSAYPTGAAPLVMDVVNVHHREYYLRMKDESKTLLHPVAFDDEQPIPNFFPAVEKGAEFRFAIAPTAHATEEDMKFAEKALVEAITLHGVGAKTAAGYGWFDYDATDFSAIPVDEDLLSKWNAEYPSGKKQKPFVWQFVNHETEDERDPAVLRTLIEFVKSKPWWPDELKRNSGTGIPKAMREWCDKFGVEM